MALEEQEAVLHNYSFRSMNTEIDIMSSLPMESSMKTWFMHIENTFSRFKENSELAYFNRLKLQTPYLSSREFFQVLWHGHQIEQWTGGIITPRVLKNLEDCGYSQSFETIDKQNQIHKEKNPILYEREWIQFEKSMQAIIRRKDIPIDLGGMAKGWSVDMAAQFMQKKGHLEGMINAGGDLRIWGQGEKWLIDIADPFDDSRNYFQLYLTNRAVATSSIQKRSWSNGCHHIIDPRNGLPADSDVIQASIVSHSALRAEVLSKLFIILGVDKGMQWMKQKQINDPYWLVLKDGQRIVAKETEDVQWSVI